MDGERLDRKELEELARWQRRMVVSFTVAMSVLVLLVIADLVFGLSETVATFLFLILLVLVVIGGFVQFGQKCPRCGYRIGFQSRLLLPDNCKKCGVAFK